MELEQEVASIIAMVQRVAGDIGYYYWNIPESFRYPAMFFPQPELTTRGETFRTYACEYSWYIKVFAQTTEKAHAIAMAVLTAIKGARNYVPLIDESGRETGKKLRLNDPSLVGVDDGAEQLTIAWTSRRPYDAAQPPKMQTFNLQFFDKEEVAHGKE